MTTTTRYTVSGMTCDHCVAAVTGELSALDGVEAVDVDLVAGGQSTVTLSSRAALPDSAVREAVAEAGYQLADQA
jgi:copper chaperone CopZ